MEEEFEIIEAASAEIELDGAIYYVEKDKDGNVLHREELPGEVMLNALSVFLKEAIDAFPVEDEPEDLEE